MKKIKKVTSILLIALCLIMSINTSASAKVTSKKCWYAATYGTTYTLTGSDAKRMYNTILNGTFDGLVMEFNRACNMVPLTKANPLYWTYKAEYALFKMNAKQQRKITPDRIKIHFSTIPLPGMAVVREKK